MNLVGNWRIKKWKTSAEIRSCTTTFFEILKYT